MGVSLFGEAVERARGDVEVTVCGAEDEDEDAGVYEAGQGVDARLDYGDDEGGGGGTGGGFCGEDKAFGVVGNERTDEEDGEDVEDDDAPEGQFDGTGDDFARVLGLADRDADEFGAEVGKGCRHEGGPEAEKVAFGAR